MSVSLVVQTPTVVRDGNNINVSIRIKGYMTNNYAYRMQIRVNGSIWKTGASYGNIDDVYTTTIASPNAYDRNFWISLYTQAASASQMILEETKTVQITAEAASYEITFDANGGTIDETSKIVNYGGTYGDLPYPSMARNRFVGWYTDPDEGDRITEDSVVGDNVPSTLYARWVPIVGGHTSLTVEQGDNEREFIMSMVRGDSAALIVVCEDEPFVAGDKIELSVRKKSKTERVVHIVVTDFEEDEDGAAYILFTPEDTMNLEFGRYVYDIQLTKASGWVTTIIELSPFILREEATYDD